MMGPWHVALTVPNADRKAAAQLRERGLDAWSPTIPGRRRVCRAKERYATRAMFPGYVFVRDPDGVGWWVLRRIPVVHRLLVIDGRLATLGDDVIQAIAATEIAQWRQRDKPRDRCSHLEPGMVVTIGAGPFFGHAGVITTLDGPGRVAVLLDMLGRKSRVSLPPEHLIA